MSTFLFPHWNPLHHGQSAMGYASERALWAAWAPDSLKIVSLDETIPYLDEVPASVERLIVRSYPMSENYGTGFEKRLFVDAADAAAQGERDSQVCARIVDYAGHHGWPANRVWVELRNEPQVWAWMGGKEPIGLLNVYTLAALQGSHRRGVQTVWGNFGSGWPDNWDLRTGLTDTHVDWEPVLPSVAEMWASDLIGIHAYYPTAGLLAGFEWFAGRWLQRPFTGKRIVLNECGYDGGVNGGVAGTGWLSYPGELAQRAARYVDELIQFRELTAADPDVVGACPFTADGDRDDWGNYEILIGELIKRLIPALRQPYGTSRWGDERTAKWHYATQPAAAKYSLDERTVSTVLALESSGDPQAESDLRPRYPVGACGLLQVMPREAATAFSSRPSRYQLKSPGVGIDWGCRILRQNLDNRGGDLARALCDYYGAAGPDSRDGQLYLGRFRTVWGELWPGAPCPLGGTSTPSEPEPEPQEPEPDAAAIRNLAINSLFPHGIAWNPGFAFPTKARELGLCEPLTGEVRFDRDCQACPDGAFILQGYDGAPGLILWAVYGEWGNVRTLSWV